jgi:hypothetical protein
VDEEKKQPTRRLKLKRVVSYPPAKEGKVETHAEEAMREVEADEADPGSKGMNYEVDRGCRSCLMVTFLMVAGIFVSIFATWIFLHR